MDTLMLHAGSQQRHHPLTHPIMAVTPIWLASQVYVNALQDGKSMLKGNVRDWPGASVTPTMAVWMGQDATRPRILVNASQTGLSPLLPANVWNLSAAFARTNQNVKAPLLNLCAGKTTRADVVMAKSSGSSPHFQHRVNHLPSHWAYVKSRLGRDASRNSPPFVAVLKSSEPAEETAVANVSHVPNSMQPQMNVNASREQSSTPPPTFAPVNHPHSFRPGRTSVNAQRPWRWTPPPKHANVRPPQRGIRWWCHASVAHQEVGIRAWADATVLMQPIRSPTNVKIRQCQLHPFLIKDTFQGSCLYSHMFLESTSFRNNYFTNLWSIETGHNKIRFLKKHKTNSF